MDQGTTLPSSDGPLPTGANMGKPQSQARHWFEPLLVLSIMIASLYFNRDRNARIRSRQSSPDSSPRPLLGDSEKPEDRDADGPNNLPSRILQKFPFLVEMFYWVLNYIAYAMTKKFGAFLYSFGNEDHRVTKIAQEHGIAVLTLEHNTFAKIFFPITEVEFQHFFMNGHSTLLTVLNQIYSLVHIPGTVAFISWAYYASSSFDTFAIIRRTMCLGNFAAFVIFCFYPCMPPRLLPPSFGFVDTVRQENAESVWVGGNNVNQLAAMPSLHFTYAFIIGSTFIYQSGVFQPRQGRRKALSTLKAFLYIVTGILYPVLVLTVIVATANHYWLDAVVATFGVGLSLLCNRVWLVLLPVEAFLLRILRLRKPTPSTREGRSGKRIGVSERTGSPFDLDQA